MALNTTEANSLLKKGASHPYTDEFGPLKIQIDYCLAWRNQQKPLKDIEVLPSEECITQHKPCVNRWYVMC